MRPEPTSHDEKGPPRIRFKAALSVFAAKSCVFPTEYACTHQHFASSAAKRCVQARTLPRSLTPPSTERSGIGGFSRRRAMRFSTRVWHRDCK